MKPPRNGGRDTTKNLYQREKEGTMPRKGSKQPYKPKVEYKYTIKDIAELAGMTRNALGVAKVHGKIEPGDFKSVVSFLTRRIIDNRLTGNLFTPAVRKAKRVREVKSRLHGSRKKPKKTVRRK
jgi:hypothetical protein